MTMKRKSFKNLLCTVFYVLQISSIVTCQKSEAILGKEAIQSWCDDIESETKNFSYYALQSAYMLDRTVCSSAGEEIKSRLLTDANASIMDGLCRMYIDTKDCKDQALKEIFNALLEIVNGDSDTRQLLQFRLHTMSHFENRLRGMYAFLTVVSPEEYSDTVKKKIHGMIQNGRVGVHRAFIFNKESWWSNADYYEMSQCDLTQWNSIIGALK